MSEEQQQITFEQFKADCEEIVKISNKLGDTWRLHEKDNVVWLESHCVRVLPPAPAPAAGEAEAGLAVQALYEVHHSLSYGVPLLLARFTAASGQLLEYELVRSRLLGGAVTADMVSPAPHPVTQLPWLQVHPCRTAATTRGLRDTGGGQQRCNYVTSFLSLYGQAVGLHLSPRYAAAAAAESPS